MTDEPRWGVELWDCLDQAVSEVAIHNSFLTNTCSKYIRERGEVEKEYARNLRRLSHKYGGGQPSTQDKLEDPHLTVQLFKTLMVELGYQAGQHELLAEEFLKTYPAEIKNTIKDVLKMVSEIKKELKIRRSTLEKSYKCLEKTKSKYVKGQDELTLNEDFSIEKSSRKDVQHKERQVEELRVEYAVQLVQTNKSQSEYYECDLPSALDSLQKICEGQCLYFASVMTRCIENERGISPIVAKCHSDMETLLRGINVKKEMSMIIERHKTGAVPPTEIQFDDLSCPGLLAGVLANSEPLVLKAQTDSGKSLYQEKRQIEKKIKAQEDQIQKGCKEIVALRKMVSTYKANPKFGCSDKLCEQLDMSVQRVEVLKSGVMLMRGELDRVQSKLEIIKMSNESYYQSNYGSVAGSRTPDPSDIYYSAEVRSVRSEDLDKEYESIEMIRTSNRKRNFYGYEEEDESNIYGTGVVVSVGSQEGDSGYRSAVYDWVTRCTASPSPPPPPLPSEPPIEVLSRVVALYPFTGEVENSVNMEEGEQFYVTEPDVEGWTRVRRLGNNMEGGTQIEGFVPSSFIKYTSTVD